MSAEGIGQALRAVAQRLDGTRLGVLAIGRIVSPLQRQLYRRTGGRLSLTGWAPVLLLTTTGRRTGKARTVPLLYLRDGDRLVICNVNPGFERPNPWVVNLRAQPRAQVQIGRSTTSVSARPAAGEELDRYWPQLTKPWPAYQDFYNNGGKRSVFVLQPASPLQRRAQGAAQQRRKLDTYRGRTLRKLRAFAARPEQIEGVAVMLGNVLRYLRRTSAGGAIEYAAQFLDGLIHPDLLRSGANPEEERRCLPGDDLVPGPIWEATRAVTIGASPAQVWSWVAQMGYGRGGWYGWNPLEREDTGVSQLLADLPPPKVGDVWLDGPGCDETRGAWTVVALEPPHTLVLHTVRDPVTGRELDPAAKSPLVIDSAWVFHLDEIAADRTRLLARTRIRMQPGWALLALKWMGGGDTVMQRRLLDGIKARAETTAR